MTGASPLLLPTPLAKAPALWLALAFFASHALALSLIRLSGPLAPAWPPVGVAFAAFIILPPSHRALIFVAVAVLDTLSNTLQGFMTFTALAYLAVSLSELWLAERLLRRFAKPTLTFANVGDVLVFVGIITVTSAASAVPASVIAKFSSGADPLNAGVIWWIGDMLGYILVTPLTVLLAFRPATRERGPRSLRLIEMGLMLLTLVVGGVWAFQGRGIVGPLDAHPYMLTVPILWATLRFDQLGTLWSVLVTGIVGVGLLMADLPLLSLGGQSNTDALILLQVFLGVVAISSLVLATALRAQQDATVANARMIAALTESEQRLRQSQKMDAIGQLAGGVAHDFNNVLAAILMQLGEIRLVKDLPRMAAELLSDVEQAAQRAARLTRQLLVFSRQQAMQSRVLDLNQLVRNHTRLLRRVVPSTHELSVQLNPAPLIVAADAGMIEQVMLNLVLNARDAQREGGKILVITSPRTVLPGAPGDLPPGEYAVITVSDSGIGIPPQNIPRLFEPFFTTKPPGQGTGLGLATAYGIVQQHGGTIGVDSRPGHGTTMEIWLPTTQAPVAEDADSIDGPLDADSGEHASPLTILVVEDEPTVRRLMARVLERDGFRVRTAVSGRDALDHWGDYAGVVDLVLTDVVMPGGVSGTQLGRELRNRHPDLPVVYTSGYDPDYDPSDVTMVPGENFVPKPATADQLLAVIRRQLVGPGRA
ncbi:hybrid sensor histidine kinase/response regulator [Gemmatimonas sp. UBA7669]|uniref:hybrid sensor histidine kinase/response regulator n=1 Tax=Gemmatimonas sp. UBA7669 TaxID=1946568 RepID=UPI0025C08D76|nr:MASE1 domain-containing protein [Gemmatimonas sp. UBA7669]